MKKVMTLVVALTLLTGAQAEILRLNPEVVAFLNRLQGSNDMALQLRSMMGIVSTNADGTATVYTNPVVFAGGVTVLGAPNTTNYFGPSVFTNGIYATTPLQIISTSAVAPASIAISPSIVSVSVSTGATATATITVSNTGGQQLSGAATVASGNGTIQSGSPYFVNGGTNTPVVVAWDGSSVPATNTVNISFSGGGGASAVITFVATNSVPEPEEPGAPLIAINPSSIDYGTMLVGSGSVTNYITVQNVGTNTLTGTASVSSPFSGGGSYSLGQNESTNLPFVYANTAAGTWSNIVTFTGGGGATASLVATSTNAPGAGNPTYQLVDYFKLEETSGYRIGSFAGSELRQQSTGQAGQVNGVMGNGYNMLTGGYRLTNSAMQNLTATNFSIAFWFKPTAHTADMILFAKALNSAGTSNSNQNEFIVALRNASKQISFTTFQQGNATGNTTLYSATHGALSNDVFYYVVVVCDKTGAQNRVYVNAVKDANTLTKAPSPGIRPFTMGNYDDGNVGYYTKGVYDELLIVQQALTDAQVAWLYNNGAGRTYEEIIAQVTP